MKLNRAALIAAVDDAMAAHKARHELKTQEWKTFLEQHKAEWIEQHNPEWAEAVKRINRRLRRGEVIERGDLPHNRARWDDQIVYSPPTWHSRDSNFRDPGPYRDHRELKRLRTVLDLTDDETVTAASLGRFGVTGQVLTEAIRQLALTGQAEKGEVQ